MPGSPAGGGGRPLALGAREKPGAADELGAREKAADAASVSTAEAADRPLDAGVASPLELPARANPCTPSVAASSADGEGPHPPAPTRAPPPSAAHTALKN